MTGNINQVFVYNPSTSQENIKMAHEMSLSKPSSDSVVGVGEDGMGGGLRTENSVVN